MITVLTMTKAQRIYYWVLLAIFSIGLGMSAVYSLMGTPAMMSEFTRLGYPVYLMKILGAAELIGILTLILAKSPVLKEWAYAGLTFNLILSAASHVFMEDPLVKVITPLLFLMVLATCYKMEHPKHHMK